MMSNAHNFCLIPNWYPSLAAHTFLTSFVKLRSEAVEALAEGLDGKSCPLDSEISRQVIADLREPMSSVPGNCFVTVDSCAPTDTERFKSKRGAVYSPLSAWKYLTLSKKVAAAAAAGQVSFICLRPFRRMTPYREFRLFIAEGKLSAMSQYNLSKYFKVLDKTKQNYWKLAENFVNTVAWQLPADKVVMDIYFTSQQKILVLDLNPWGDPTDPLLLRRWERDWETPIGVVTMAPPTSISGDVNVTF